MQSDEFNYIDDSLVNIKKRKPIKAIVLILFIIALGAIICFFILPNISHEKKESDESDNTFISDNKVYDKESGLAIPTNYENKIYKYAKISLNVTDIRTDKEGYTFYIDFVNESSYYVTVNCVAILIDGFETSASFTTTAYENSSSFVSATIPKTELDLLEINDFDDLLFLLEFTSDSPTYTFKDFGHLSNGHMKSAENQKNVVKYDELENIDVSVYDKKEDAYFTYIYFDIKNKSHKESYNILLNKLYVNKKIYDYNELEEFVHYQGERVFYIKIPKSEYSNVETISISFFFIKDKDTLNQSITISNLKELIVNNL